MTTQCLPLGDMQVEGKKNAAKPQAEANLRITLHAKPTYTFQRSRFYGLMTLKTDLREMEY